MLNVIGCGRLGNIVPKPNLVSLPHPLPPPLFHLLIRALHFSQSPQLLSKPVCAPCEKQRGQLSMLLVSGTNLPK